MESKSKFLPIIVMISMLAGMAYAVDCTFVTPGVAGTISGAAYVFNISVTEANITNCSITGSSSNSGDSWIVGTALNATGTDNCNVTVTSAAEYDAADWSFAATCVDTSGNTIESCTRTGVTINNTVPAIASCTIDGTTAAATQEVSDSTVAFVCTVEDAYACNVYWKTTTAHAFGATAGSGSDFSTGAVTLTSSYASAQTLTANLYGAGDDYKNAYIDCTDGTDTTTTTTYQIKTAGTIGGATTGGGNGIDTTKVVSFFKENKKVVLLLLFALVLIVLFFAMKKKRR